MNENNSSIIEPVAFTRAEAPSKKPLIRLNPLSVTVGVVFVILAVAALFMFNARAVRFDISPAPTALSIDGTLPTYQLGERYLMQQGEYDFKATLAGYHPLETTVTVGEAAEQDFTFELVRLPGIVSVEAIDSSSGEAISDAEVIIDQSPVAMTPALIDEVAAGVREIYINHPRYQPFQAELDVIGRRESQTLSAKLDPAWAEVSISSLPAGAEILIDEAVIATTPAVVEILEGVHRVALKHPGYKRYEVELEIAPSEPQQLEDIVLVKSDGMVNIQSNPPGAAITISGQYQGQTPLSVALAPDSYTLLATRAGFKNLKRQLTISPEQDQDLNLRLQPVTGLVKLEVQPAGAVLFVNGDRRGDASQTLELTARSHQLRVELDGYATFETEVFPQPGLPQQLSVTLLTTEAARVSAIPQQIRTHTGEILRFIVPGELQMGAGRREPGRRSNEIEKDVLLTRSFYLSETEITNASFKAYAPGHNSGMLGRALLSEDDRPVVNVSWDDAVQFCNWLSEKDGLPVAYELANGNYQLIQPFTTGYRLPTEAEWAWAARYDNPDQVPTRFPWGDRMPPPVGAGNFADESAANMVPYSIAGYNDNYRGPAPPSTFVANGYGLYDLAGNVSEWINDYYDLGIHREKLIDPMGPDTGEYYVIRGSNYTHGRFSELRWTFRDYGKGPRPDVGFRIARFLESEE